MKNSLLIIKTKNEERTVQYGNSCSVKWAEGDKKAQFIL